MGRRTDRRTDQGEQKGNDPTSRRQAPWWERLFRAPEHKGVKQHQLGLFWGVVAAVLAVGIAIGAGWSPWNRPGSMPELAAEQDTTSFSAMVDEGPNDNLVGSWTTTGTEEVTSADEALALEETGRESTIESLRMGEELIDTTVPASTGTETDDEVVTAPEREADALPDAEEEAPTSPIAVAATPSVDAVPSTEGEGASAGERTVGGDPTLPAVSLSQMAKPVVGHIVRPFGWYRYPALSEWRYATSVVIEPEDETGQVRAALAGRVRDVVNEGGLWRLRIEHAGNFTTEYEGLSEVHVASFEMVDQRQVIGQVNWGEGSLGLTFALLQDGEPLNPETFFDDMRVVEALAP